MSVNQYDLVLTDLSMPEMDGIALLRAALEKDHNLVGIMMTGEGTITAAVEAMKTGAFDYILKPFKLSVMLPVLARALAVRRLRLEEKTRSWGFARAQTHRRTRSCQQGTRSLQLFRFARSARTLAAYYRVSVCLE